MNHFHFPKRTIQGRTPIQNVNEIFAEQSTFGQRASDRVAAIVGSWPFILIQSGLLLVWVILNVVALVYHWDPYPFILMNLVLSLQAAFTAPIIMMSQNRQAEKDRIDAHNDFIINQKAEEEIRTILEHLDAQNIALIHIYDLLHGIKAQDKLTEPEQSAAMKGSERAEAD